MKTRSNQFPFLPLLASLLLAAPPLAAETAVTVKTIPSAPAPGDPIVVSIAGSWPDSCSPATNSELSIHRDGGSIEIALGYFASGSPCAAVVTPWTLDVPAGQLPEGSYHVNVWIRRSLLAPELLGTATFAVATPPVRVVYVPGVAVDGWAGKLGSSLGVVNNGVRTALLEPVAAYDAAGSHLLSATSSLSLPPGASGSFDTRPIDPAAHVQLVAIRTPGRVAFRADLEGISVDTGEVLARLPLPVFTELIPAGMTAVAGDVKLTASECAPGAADRRRVNVTLFNSSARPATFTVKATAGEMSVEQTAVVAAESLLQLNDVSLETLPLCSSPGAAWFRIGADQPFLAYVSTSRTTTAAGTTPYEVFPARLEY